MRSKRDLDREARLWRLASIFFAISAAAWVVAAVARIVALVMA